jgi:hypothetical protein
VSGFAEAQRRSREFAEAHGDALARRRAAALCGGDTEAALAELDAADLARADLLRRVLGVCEELRALRSPLARRALGVLESTRCDDGAFAPASLPLAERLQRTGDLGGILARSPYGRPESLDAAGDFLARHFAPDLFQGFQWANIAAYAHYFANAPHEAADEVLQWCGRELERGFRARQFDALDTARVLVRCDAHGIPGARLEREELLLGLLAQQQRDGSFGGELAPEARVEATLQGLHALIFLGGGSAARDATLDSRVPAR